MASQGVWGGAWAPLDFLRWPPLAPCAPWPSAGSLGLSHTPPPFQFRTAPVTQVVRLDCLTIDPIENPFNEASALQMLRDGNFGVKPPTIVDVEDVFQVRRGCGG